MKAIKTAMIVMASLGTFSLITAIPAKSIASFSFYGWHPFWQRLANILLNAFELYLEMVIKRGYFRVAVPGNPIIQEFNTQANIDAAAQRGLVFDGTSLTLPQDIVIYVREEVGVAIQQGNYPLDNQGNFHFDLIRVEKPVPSTTFPLPDGTE